MHPDNHSGETPRQLSERLVREALTEQPVRQSMREIEMSLAYERASSMIESSCAGASTAELWYDLDEVDPMVATVDEEAAYLDSRGLLDHHPDNPRWVSIRDESEGTL